MLHDVTKRGPHRPVTAMPPRAPSSIRRTTTIDTLSPDGLDQDMVVDAHGRDLLTGADGSAVTVGEASLTARLKRWTRVIVALDTTPSRPSLAELVGTSTASGFRGRVDHAVPDLARTGGVLYQLLDDLTGASLVAGYAQLLGQLPQLVEMPATGERIAAMSDVCAGWAADGYMISTLRTEGRNPVPIGPRAPVLDRDDDPDAFHPVGRLPRLGMRRRRRIDVRATPGAVLVDAHFRDTHGDDDDTESVVHEYAVAVELDADGETVVAASADPRVLPWIECPQAADSASRLEGCRVGDLRPWVRQTFTGTTTCTHLNDTLRALADVPALVARLRTGRG